MTEIITIQNVRGYCDEKGTAYLNVEDVARGLGFVEKAASGNITIRWRTVRSYLESFGYKPVAGSCDDVKAGDYIPENMFYRLAMKAKNEVAEVFQAKIADEILPAIRKHGVYATDDFIERTLANPDFAIRVFTQLKAEREKNALLTEQNAFLSERNTILQPKADYCDAVLDSDELLDISAIAQEYGFSGQTFNRMLADFMIQYRKGNAWFLYQKYAGCGYTRRKTVVVNGRTVTYLAWTHRGRYFLYQELKQRGILPVHLREREVLKGA